MWPEADVAGYPPAYPSGLEPHSVMHADDVHQVAHKLQCANVSNLICVVVVAHSNASLNNC